MFMMAEINWGPINALASALLTIALFYIGLKTSKIDKLEDQLKKNSDDRINTQMQLIRAELQIPLTELTCLMAAMKERMGDGDDHFEQVDEKNHRLEVKTQQMVLELKTYVVQNMATKEDVSKLNDRLTQAEHQRA